MTRKDFLRALKVSVSLVVTLVLALAIFPKFHPVWALECRQETLFYDNWDDEKIYKEADLFADSSYLAWGTEVCPIRVNKRWLTTWVQVRMEDGLTGWLDDSDLVTMSDFYEIMRSRHADKISRLETLISEVNSIELLFEEFQIEVPSPDLQGVLLTWTGDELLSEPTPSTMSEDQPPTSVEPVARSTPTPQLTATPRPTRRPQPTATPRPTRTPRPTVTPRPNRQATRQAEEAIERQKGFHCLSVWDGNHDGFERLVKPMLNDPDSMKTYETRIAPAEEGTDGRLGHFIIMEFGATNAFGAMMRSIATGWVDNETCEATLLYIE